MISLLLQSTLAFISALAGAFIVFKIKLDHFKLCFLISLSAGALAGAAFITLIPHAAMELGTLEVVLSVISGYTLFWVINKFYFHLCPACSASHFDEQTTKKFSEIVLLLFTALSFHSFLDGFALASGNADADHGVFSAVFAHKFPEGIALASLMAGANYPKKKIFEFVFLVEITTIVGTLIGMYVMPLKATHWMAYIQGHISGSFLFLSFHALVGEIFKNHKKLVIFSFLSGIIIIFVVSRFLH
ncbi:MAG: ZIP family metal transporter [Ignavibacteria bacterium]|nr:ZIP family metal transporter [Ignavibacteria bacterium]